MWQHNKPWKPRGEFPSNQHVGKELVESDEELSVVQYTELVKFEHQHNTFINNLEARVAEMARSSEFLPNFWSRDFSVQSTVPAWAKAYIANPRDFTAEVIQYAEEMFTTFEKSLAAIDTTLNTLEIMSLNDRCFIQYIYLPIQVMTRIWTQRKERNRLNDRIDRDMKLFNEMLYSLSCMLDIQLQINSNDIRQNLRALAYVTLAAPINRQLATPFQKLETGANWRGLQEAVTGTSVTGGSGRLYQQWLRRVWDKSLRSYKAGQMISSHPLWPIFEKYKTNSQRYRIRDVAMSIRRPISNNAIHSYIRPDGDFIILQEQWTEEEYDVMVATFQLLQRCHLIGA